jgi:hypothetical protein
MPAAGVGPVAGTKFYIGPAGSAPTSPDLWIEVGDVNNLGDIAEKFTEVNVASVGSGDEYQLKGTRTFPNFTLEMNRNDGDAGQIALKAAASATRGTLYPFRVLDYDGTVQGSAIWQGEVFGYGPAYGSVNTLRMVKTSISIRPSTLTLTAGT